MAIDVRGIRDEELRDWFESLTIGFLDRPDVDKIAEDVRPYWDLKRVFAAVDGDTIVGTARTWATELTVPGNAQIKASAVSAVSVRPTHRRRGLLGRMMAAEHAAARERGELVSLLYAAEFPIYGRFGYGVATQWSAWTLDTRSTAFHAAAGGTTGRVDVIRSDESAIETLRGVFDALRVRQPGEIWRRPITWKTDLGLAGAAWGDAWKGFVAVHRDETGVADGYVRYRAEAKWDRGQPRSTLTVDDLHALTVDAQVALWRFLASIDLVATIRAERRHPADVLPWVLTNGRAADPVETGDALWLKLHDIPAALEARTYERSGSLVIETVDRGGATAPGLDERASRIRTALDVSPDGARATVTDRSPDLTIDVAALGAAYLGGTRLRDAALAAGWDEHRAGAMDDATRLFATFDPPWCTTFF